LTIFGVLQFRKGVNEVETGALTRALALQSARPPRPSVYGPSEPPRWTQARTVVVSPHYWPYAVPRAISGSGRGPRQAHAGVRATMRPRALHAFAKWPSSASKGPRVSPATISCVSSPSIAQPSRHRLLSTRPPCFPVCRPLLLHGLPRPGTDTTSLPYPSTVLALLCSS
jgi:hypothetical protein